MIDPRIIIEEFLESHDLDFEKSSANTFLVTLPGEKKLQTHCALIVGDNSLSINAFVIRKPDENADKVHEWLLTKNASMYAVTYAINELGDIFLVGRLPLPAVTDVEIDRILGAVLQYSDSSFNPLLELGFASSIRREWAWRVSRGESLSNGMPSIYLLVGLMFAYLKRVSAKQNAVVNYLKNVVYCQMFFTHHYCVGLYTLHS